VTACPYWAKSAYRRAVSLLPGSAVPHGREYGRTLGMLADTQFAVPERLAGIQTAELRTLLRHCSERVPYYRDLLKRLSLRPEDFRKPEDVSLLPFMDKETVREAGADLVATGFSRTDEVHESTGGTGGPPLSFLSLKGFSDQREKAFWHHLARRVGFGPGMWIAELRNASLGGSRLYEIDHMRRKLVLDPFKLNPGNIEAYLEAMKRYRTRFLHTYPSAATVLLRFVAEASLDAKGILHAVLAGSENIYAGQREFIESGFGARFFSWYGHSEKLVLAGECECSADYHVFPQYGIAELVAEDGSIVTGPGIRGEIVGTGFNNPLMPFIRYRTGDYAEWIAGGPCACGRCYPRLAKVTGRWFQELVHGRNGARISMAGLNMHSDVLDRVMNYQFVQSEVGKLVMRIVPGKGFMQEDPGRIRMEFGRKLRGEVDLEVEIVDGIPRTPRGKQVMLVQHLEEGP
jgi:phenylacetate-CoA ligase